MFQKMTWSGWFSQVLGCTHSWDARRATWLETDRRNSENRRKPFDHSLAGVSGVEDEAYITQDTERERDFMNKFGASDHQTTVFGCIQDQCMQLRKGGQPTVVQSHWQIEIESLRPMCPLHSLYTRTIENKSVSQWPFLQYPAVSPLMFQYTWIPGYPWIAMDTHG